MWPPLWAAGAPPGLDDPAFWSPARAWSRQRAGSESTEPTVARNRGGFPGAYLNGSDNEARSGVVCWLETSQQTACT